MEIPHVIDIDQAHRIATGWADGNEPGIYEFDLGFVVWRQESDPDDDSPVGAGCAVIDRETGEVTPWPALAAPLAAELYRTVNAAYRRFPPTTRAMLQLGGWRPARDVRLIIEHRWSQDHSTGDPDPLALDILAEFGGLTIRTLRLEFAPRLGVDGVVAHLRDEPVSVDASGAVTVGGVAAAATFDGFLVALCEG